MAGRLFGFRSQNNENYDVWKLVDSRILEDSYQSGPKKHLICDIDKTYLETEFESLVKMARIAFEDARDKITVSGARDVLLAARWGDLTSTDNKNSLYPRPLHFVSSSPPQLRNVLEEKLAIDGLDWSTDTFKNQAYNLKKGKFNQLKQQAAYKSAAIFKLIQDFSSGSELFLIGDNAESDAFIYLGVKLYLDGMMSKEGYKKYLQIAGIGESVANDFVNGIGEPEGKTVSGIYIRNLPTSKFVLLDPLTSPVQMFDEFFEVALLLIAGGVIEVSQLNEISTSFHNRHGMPLKRILESLTVVSDQLEISSEYRDEIERVIARISPFVETDLEDSAPIPMANRKPDISEYRKLDEDLILKLSANWIENIEAERHPVKK